MVYLPTRHSGIRVSGHLGSIPVCVSGLQAVGSCINHLATDPAVVLPAFTQVYGAHLTMLECEKESGWSGVLDSH